MLCPKPSKFAQAGNHAVTTRKAARTHTIGNARREKLLCTAAAYTGQVLEHGAVQERTRLRLERTDYLRNAIDP